MAETEPTSTTRPRAAAAPDTAARLDWITARALACNRAAIASQGRATWSDATRDRLYGRMFPNDPVIEAPPDGAVRPER